MSALGDFLSDVFREGLLNRAIAKKDKKNKQEAEHHKIVSESTAPTKTLLTEHHALLSAVSPELSTISTIDPSTLTASDTLLIVDVQHDFLPGGAFGVAEGDEILPGISSLISHFAKAGSTILATRDYHPRNHCSFTTHGGPFPPHCLQGSRGSMLHPTVVDALQPLMGRDNVFVVFKAFSADIDSFGAFAYTEEESRGRLSTNTTSDDGNKCHCTVDWTGGFVLYSSMQCDDVNAPPDVMSVLHRKALKEVIPKDPKGRMFVCGLAMDYCVIDSAVNFVATGCDGDEKRETFLVHGLTRAAHLPGVGGFGSGFLSDPRELVDKMKVNGIGLVDFVGV